MTFDDEKTIKLNQQQTEYLRNKYNIISGNNQTLNFWILIAYVMMTLGTALGFLGSCVR